MLVKQAAREARAEMRERHTRELKEAQAKHRARLESERQRFRKREAELRESVNALIIAKQTLKETN